MQNGKSKKRSRLYVLLALTAVLGLGGVVAATSISINSGTPLSLGAGYATATTCDADVTISTNQAYDTRENIYKITAFTVTGVDQSSTNPTTGIPLYYEFDKEFEPLTKGGRYLDPQAAKTAIEAVANQGKS